MSKKTSKTYDVFRKLPDGRSIWVTAISVEKARVLMEVIEETSDVPYYAYDPSSGMIVASVNLLN